MIGAGRSDQGPLQRFLDRHLARPKKSAIAALAGSGVS
jgi:hypothetical protein